MLPSRVHGAKKQINFSARSSIGRWMWNESCFRFNVVFQIARETVPCRRTIGCGTTVNDAVILQA
jgi:hypothetical protein